MQDILEASFRTYWKGMHKDVEEMVARYEIRQGTNPGYVTIRTTKAVGSTETRIVPTWCILGVVSTPVSSVEEYLEERGRVLEELKRHMLRAQQIMKKQADGHRKTSRSGGEAVRVNGPAAQGPAQLFYMRRKQSTSLGFVRPKGDVPLQGDFSAEHMILEVCFSFKFGRGADPLRREKLIDLLDINLQWRMHKVSDGQRRRFQICIGLLHPYKVLLLDEVTVDLDVVTRMDLLDFFKEECEQVVLKMEMEVIHMTGSVGWCWLMPKSARIRRSHRMSAVRAARALYSDSVDDRATVVCFLTVQHFGGFVSGGFLAALPTIVRRLSGGFPAFPAVFQLFWRLSSF
ncbi:hypothetical protein KFK09_010850 [Dendrobium nobile]|uniref:ABC transporter domain-containing protein n=1 Tax=Dendrobium nobile TaxID=94219 RepID=A0A8T3BB32_DENNO|nr:hypothetical protein KFK09_010850 [Dendrobium nobile]